jgi:CubicO group peptidase (beta-lactamase class C family)
MRKPARNIGACCVVAVLAAACTVVPVEAPPADDAGAFDDAFDAVMTRYSLPGLALGVVRDGEVVYARTAGELVAGSGKPVTRDTLFKIASNTKAMTTGVLARLVDAGKLHWDDPVTRYLPSFRMHDPWVTREMQVRDLLIHNSGLREGAGDLMLWPEPNHFTRADVLAGLAFLKPVHSFRSHYDYDNLLYIVAGEVAAAAAGQPYEDLLRRELFGPLGMTRCQVGEWRRDAVGNVAQPHVKQDDGYRPGAVDGEIVPAVTMAAAGGVRCSLNDMLLWVRMWLDPADAWLTPARRGELWAAQMPRPTPERERRWNGTNFSAYGYGWRLSDVDGKLRVAHTGTLSGMYSAVTLLPGSATGFVFLINGDAADARVALNQALVKLLTSGAGAPTVDHYAGEIERERAAESDASAGGAATAAPDRRPARLADSAAMLGIYRDPWFGEAALCERAGSVSFRSAKSPKLTGKVVRVGPRLLVDWDDASVDTEAWLDFRPATGAGDVATLTLAKVDPEADFSYDYEDLEFSRIRDCPMNDEIDALMRPYDGDVPGAAVLVVRDGEPLVRRSYGLADLARGTKVTPATNFRLASVTKQFTAAAILLLAEEGRLGLDDPARKWLPTLPAAADTVTIRQLLTHTSGLIDYEDVIPASMTAQLQDADVLTLLEDQDRTYFPPGTAYRYSNSGYALLALVVERASGRSFAEFLRERIFQPLGMAGTVAQQEGISTVGHRAFGHSDVNGSWVRTDQSQTSAVLGDGGIYSSIDDLAKWDAALDDGRLLSAESRRLAFTPATPTDDPAVEYGFGWRITGDSLWHSGETMGFRNVIVRFPERRLAVVVLTNRDDPEPYRTALAIAALAEAGTPEE